MMDLWRLRAQLVRYARRLGLAALGMLEARRLEALEAELKARQARGRYPAFCETDPARRADPEQWLPGARTILVGALPYLPPGARPRPSPGQTSARLAAYAVAPDYHRVLRRRLEALARWAAAETGLHPHRDFRVFVDTGPPVERELLRLSGVGWIGKNTCAYVPGAGSWVVLGVLVTTLPLPVETPAQDVAMAPADACAECDRCLRACPTHALSPYEMNPAACISQITQLRGALPEASRRQIGRWVFGCDICQIVCPHNTPRSAPLAYRRPAPLEPAPGVDVRMPLERLMTMDGPAFARVFGPTAASWRGRNVLLRNAAYVAGLILAGRARHPDGEASDGRPGSPTGPQAPREPAVVSDTRVLRRRLERLAQDHPSPVVKEAARWALQQADLHAAPRPVG